MPVNKSNFKNPRKDDMLVSFAGPAVNLVVAMACMLLLLVIVLVIRILWPQAISLNLVAPYAATSLNGLPFARWILVFIVFLKQLFYTSLILGIFNLLPIPPLDGSWILSGVLPEGVQGVFQSLRRFSFLLIILLATTPVLDYVLGFPISVAWTVLGVITSFMGFA